jgi:hypothetical protein
MNSWRKLFQQKLDEGTSAEAARNFATSIIKERRANFNPHTVIGMAELEAKEKLDENGYSFRVIRRDVGSVGPIYLDLCETRCNVSIVEGKVEKIIDMC